MLNFLNENVRHIYPHVSEYLQNIGNLTAALISDERFEGEAVMALEFWLSICWIEQIQNQTASLNIVQQIYASLLELCFKAFETEIRSNEEDIDAQDDNDMQRSVSFSGLNLAQNVVRVIGKPAFEIILRKATSQYFTDMTRWQG